MSDFLDPLPPDVRIFKNVVRGHHDSLPTSKCTFLFPWHKAAVGQNHVFQMIPYVFAVASHLRVGHICQLLQMLWPGCCFKIIDADQYESGNKDTPFKLDMLLTTCTRPLVVCWKQVHSQDPDFSWAAVLVDSGTPFAFWEQRCPDLHQHKVTVQHETACQSCEPSSTDQWQDQAWNSSNWDDSGWQASTSWQHTAWVTAAESELTAGPQVSTLADSTSPVPEQADSHSLKHSPQWQMMD
jgi:hypothetical protein